MFGRAPGRPDEFGPGAKDAKEKKDWARNSARKGGEAESSKDKPKKDKKGNQGKKEKKDKKERRRRRVRAQIQRLRRRKRRWRARSGGGDSEKEAGGESGPGAAGDEFHVGDVVVTIASKQGLYDGKKVAIIGVLSQHLKLKLFEGDKN